MYFSNCVSAFLFVFCFAVQNICAQDVAVYSTYSDSLNKAIKQEVEKLNLTEAKDALGITSVSPLTESYDQLKDEKFSFSVSSEKTKILGLYKSFFADQVSQLEKPQEAEITSILNKLQDKLKADFKEKRAEILAPLMKAVESLKKESRLNITASQKLSAAELVNSQYLVKEIFKNIEKSGLTIVSSKRGQVVNDVKKEAAALLIIKAQKEFPDLNPVSLQTEATRKFKFYKVGDQVKIKYAPNPSRVLTASGAIRSMDTVRVKIGFNTISIKDIIDPLERIAMSKTETLKNREAYVKEKIAEQKNKCQQYYNDNLQAEVDLLVAANEKNGYVLNLGSWKLPTDIVKSSLTSQITKLKQSGISEFEKIALLYNEKISSLSQVKKEFTTTFTKLRELISKELDSDSVIAQAKAAQAALEMSEKEAEETLAKELAEKDRQKAEALEAEQKAKAEHKAAIKAKQDAIANQTKKAEESSSSTLFIALAIAAVLLLGFIAFNRKVHDKILGNKRQSMSDIVNQDAISAHQSMPKPESNPLPVGPRGNMAPQAITRPPIDKPKVDVDISVETTDAEQNKVIERKKIALNLKGSTSTLDKNLITPPSTPPVGGLTPPGSGMTPPKTGLTPPGSGLTPLKVATPPADEAIDKSNLILNPNLQADGQKLRLKK